MFFNLLNNKLSNKYFNETNYIFVIVDQRFKMVFSCQMKGCFAYYFWAKLKKTENEENGPFSATKPRSRSESSVLDQSLVVLATNSRFLLLLLLMWSLNGQHYEMASKESPKPLVHSVICIMLSDHFRLCLWAIWKRRGLKFTLEPTK